MPFPIEPRKRYRIVRARRSTKKEKEGVQAQIWSWDEMGVPLQVELKENTAALRESKTQERLSQIIPEIPIYN